MPTTYPATKQAITDPSGTQTLSAADHSGLHTTLNDTLEAVQDTVGTTLGTNVLKNFAAGDFPARVNSSGTFVHNLGGGTLTNTAFNTGNVGTSAITGGTATSLKVVGTDILSLSGLLGTSGVLGTVSVTVGSFTNTTAAAGTNLGSISFTPQVAVSPLIFWNTNWNNSGIPGTNHVNLQINGSSYGTSAGFGSVWQMQMWRGTAASVTTSASGVFFGPSLAAAGTHTIVVPVYTTAGTAVAFGYRLFVLPLPSA